MVRDTNDPGPWIPGIEQRFRWVGESHPDQVMVRERVQDGGKNLYVLRLPPTVAGSEVKVLAVGFYPDELQSASWTLCDPRQREDWTLGRMVVLKTLGLNGFFSANYGRDMSGFNPGDDTLPEKKWWFEGGSRGSVDCYMGPLDDASIAEVVRNNRNARADLKRKSTASYLAKEIENALEEKENKAINDSGFLDAYTEAYMDTEHIVRGNPRVSMYTPRGS